MNILIVSDIPPCRQYTAGLVEETFCNYLIGNHVKFSLLTIQSENIYAQIPAKIQSYADNLIFLPKRSEQCGALSAVRKNLMLISNEIYSSYTLPRKVKKALQNQKFDLIWGIVQGQTMICFISSLAKLLKVEYNVQIWDPPQWWLTANNFPNFFTRRVLAQFKELLAGSNWILTASPSMSVAYKQQFKCNTTELMPSLPAIQKTNIENTPYETDKGFYKIIFSGQKYARDELMIFLRVLDSINWQFQGKKIHFELYSNCLDNEIFLKFPLVRQYSWVDQDLLHQKIAESDLAYCPYPFSKELELVSQMSFPGKLVSYLHCMVPIFFHGPVNSSITTFAHSHGLNFICESLELNQVRRVLLSALALSKTEKQRLRERTSNVFNACLSSEKMFENISRSLGK